MTAQRALQSLLAGMAGLIAAWPITTLISGGNWVRDSLVVVVLAIGVGLLCRSLRVPESLVLWIQIGTVLASLWVMFIAGSDLGTIDAICELATEADRTIRQYAAPAPETTGLRFVVVALIGLLTVLTDVISVGLRSPAVAGLPLMTLYLVSAANSTNGLGPWYFVAAATAWLLMLVARSKEDVESWSNTTAAPTKPMLMSDRLGIGGFGSVARTVGVIGVVAALILPGLMPSAGQRFLGDGLGQRQGPVGTVGLSNTLDVGRSLVNNNRTPVLQYTTTDTTAPPLRVGVTSTYADGEWTSPPPDASLPGSNKEAMDAPTGLDPRTGFDEQTLTVTESKLLAGQFAAPAPLLKANLGGVSWSYDPQTSQINPRRTANKYTATYARLAPGALPRSTKLPSGLEADLAVDRRARPQLLRALAQIPAAKTPFDRAIAIQDYLRGTGGFSYSLTLAPTRVQADGTEVDPITNFLLTKQGYCVQFATAMIMMARSEGIPARMAIGFLAGTPNNANVYSVRQSDAHAWPELYFPDLGWTRFEPTPGSRSGAAPIWALPPDQQVPRTERPTPTTNSRTASPEETSSSSTTSSTSGGGSRDSGVLSGVLKVLGWIVLAGVVLAALGALLPFAARREADRRRRAAETHAEVVEADWSSLRDGLVDLGVAESPPVSPRAQQMHYRKAAALGTEGGLALDRAVATLERARYGQPDENLDLRPDAEIVLTSVRRGAGFRHRVGARFAPRAGRRWLARVLQPWNRSK